MPKIIEAPLKPFWKNTDGSAKLYHGDSVEVLQKLPPRSFNMCVTSPPYWGLRDYGNDKSIEVGSEKTPKDFILKMVWVFTYVRRLLREDGTLWLNLGDTYGPRGLTGIPWRVALALQNDGWFLRQEIIWSKPSPMPESVKNRCTKAHEHVFLLSKSKEYYCNMEAISSPATESHLKRQKSAYHYNDEEGRKNAKASQSRLPRGGSSARPVYRKRYDVRCLAGAR